MPETVGKANNEAFGVNSAANHATKPDSSYLFPPPVIANGPFSPTIADDSFVFEPLRRWAVETPNKTAVVGDFASFTYHSLDELTNRFARALRARGIGRGDIVAIILPRGTEALIAIIAVLKAGAAYAPLDPETPAERVRLCLEDANPRLIISRDVPVAAQGYAGTSYGDLVEEASGLSEEPLERAETELTRNDNAYVIFTSGTTGRPKGVPITHESLTNFVRGDQEACIRVGRDDCVFQGFSPASDGHHEETWPTFLAGATLAVATANDVHGGQELGDFLERHGVTIISCAPTLLSMVERDIPSIKRILFGAERCPAEIVRRWWQPGREIINTYGPTEATVGTTFGLCMPDDPVTIGVPLPNYFCYILDDNLKPVERGEEGELCISGVGVAKGYIGSGAKKADKFLPNPFADPELHNERLYKTGDRVRRNADGNIEWLGRIDSQIKIRGYRIELSDIESHLMADPAVRLACAIVRDGELPSPTLAALLVAKSGAQIDPSDCLTRLRAELPAYMLPQVFEEVDSIPTLPSGKIDRPGAQKLRGKPLEAIRTILPPRTDTERMLLSIWEKLFPGVAICRTDDFFNDLGGYSLLAARFVSILRNEHGYQSVSVRDIYDRSILQDFAAFLDDRKDEKKDDQEKSVEFAAVPQGRFILASIIQGLSILFLFGFQACFWLSPIVVAAYLQGWVHWQLVPSIFVGLLAHAVSVPLGLLFVALLKWIAIGKFKEGRYPVWGGYFLRWWFVQRVIDIAPRVYITGTPLSSLFLRMLGAKVGHKVVFESIDIDCPDLIEVGNDCLIEERAWLRTSQVAHGYLTIRRISIGDGCVIGVRSGVAGGAAMERGAFLTDLSCISNGETIPADEEWAGSPARRKEKPEAPLYDPALQPSTRRWMFYGIFQALLVLLLPLIDMIPFMTAMMLFYQTPDELDFQMYLWSPVYAVGMILIVCLQVLIVKWLVIGKMKPGVYRTPSNFYLRKWFVDKLVEVQTSVLVPIFDTLYTRPWCISMGMKCGPRTEIALPARLPYDLVELGEENFLCSDCAIGMPMRRNSQMALEHTVMDKRVFLGNDSVISQGTGMPVDSLLGALSCSPSPEVMGNMPNQVWLGSPAFALPTRQHFDQFDIKTTYKPTLNLYLERLAHETLRIVMPSLASLLIATLMLTLFDSLWENHSIWLAMLATPFLELLAAILGTLSLLALKLILIGKYKPAVKPLWSRFVWKTESFAMYFHDFLGQQFVSSLLGTPYLSAFLRFMGAKVGKRAFIDTCDLTEFDLISIGDDASINFDAPLQAHLFEDRVMKLGRIKVGDRCSVGCYSVVLLESELQNDSHVGHISLIMKGETLPSGTFWVGSPARMRSEICSLADRELVGEKVRAAVSK